jgi:hypothetical protein
MHPGHHHGHWGGSCCCERSGFGAGFWTKEEKIAWLEQYLESLQDEAKAVEERIAALKEE